MPAARVPRLLGCRRRSCDRCSGPARCHRAARCGWGPPSLAAPGSDGDSFSSALRCDAQRAARTHRSGRTARRPGGRIPADSCRHRSGRHATSSGGGRGRPLRCLAAHVHPLAEPLRRTIPHSASRTQHVERFRGPRPRSQVARDARRHALRLERCRGDRRAGSSGKLRTAASRLTAHSLPPLRDRRRARAPTLRRQRACRRAGDPPAPARASRAHRARRSAPPARVGRLRAIRGAKDAARRSVAARQKHRARSLGGARRDSGERDRRRGRRSLGSAGSRVTSCRGEHDRRAAGASAVARGARPHRRSDTGGPSSGRKDVGHRSRPAADRSAARAGRDSRVPSVREGRASCARCAGSRAGGRHAREHDHDGVAATSSTAHHQQLCIGAGGRDIGQPASARAGWTRDLQDPSRPRTTPRRRSVAIGGSPDIDRRSREDARTDDRAARVPCGQRPRA